MKTPHKTLIDEWLEKAKAAEQEKILQEKASRPKGQKCSNCINHLAHQFTNKLHYCKLRRQAGTSYGYAKTKASGWCNQWKSEPQK